MTETGAVKKSLNRNVSRKRKINSEAWKNAAFIIPAIAYVAILSFYPTGYAVYGGFQTRLASYTLANYKTIAELHLVRSIYNTAVVTGAALAFQFLLGFIIATILTKEFRGKKAFSILFLIPFGVATVVAGFVFAYIFGETYSAGGYANSILHMFGLGPVNFVTNYWNSVFAIVIADSWKNTPIVALILLAGMNSISPDIYHQAVIDGAGPVSRFFRITLPNLAAYIAIALIIRGVSEFNIFAMALLLFHEQLLTTITYSLYQPGALASEAFAASTVLLAFILAFTGIILFNRSRSFKIQNGLKRKKNWFEKYRWFYTSEGHLCVLQKGTRSGPLLKRLSPDFLHISSDVSGIGSAYIDYDGRRQPAQLSIDEAAQFLLSFAGNWNAESGETEMYWTEEDSQEKNYFSARSPGLELAISEVSGEALPMIAPSGIRRIVSGQVAFLEPGSSDSAYIAAQISRALMLKKKEVRRLLPAGGLKLSSVSSANTAKVLANRKAGDLRT